MRGFENQAAKKIKITLALGGMLDRFVLVLLKRKQVLKTKNYLLTAGVNRID
jgi:hypothetical protein